VLVQEELHILWHYFLLFTLSLCIMHFYPEL